MNVSIATLNSTEHQQLDFNCREIRIGSGSQCDLIVKSDSGIANLHCVIKSQPDGQIEITNFNRSIVLNNGPRIHRTAVVVTSLPAHFSIGDTQFQINSQNPVSDVDHALRSLSNGWVTEQNHSTASPLPCVEEVAPGSGTLTAWLETVGDLQKSAAGSKAFFKDAARTIYNPGGMDGCMILRPGADDRWEIVSSHIPYPNCNISFRSDLVHKAVQQQQTIFHEAAQIASDQPFQDTHTAVVCPITDNEGQTIAVVYGFRARHSTNNRIGARALEVQFVQLIAGSIAAAMMRLEKEAEASRSRVLLEQAFSPKVVRQLEVDPNILAGVTREVTVLFADLRDFSAISEKAGPKVTYQMLTDVMDRFSEIIRENDGVIIDYYGDGISAFWNAPIEQENHTLLAVKAAHEILGCLPELNSFWGTRLLKPLRAGVGVHCGEAQVGNSGSSTRLKYGPQGATVNIASRLETTTKEIGVPLVVSEAVADKVSEHFFGHRLCNTQLRGMKDPTSVFELHAKPVSADAMDLLSRYDESLALYESCRFSDASAMLCELSIDMPGAATEYLLKQTMQKNSHNIDRREYLEVSDVGALTEEKSKPEKSPAAIVSSTSKL